MAIVLVTRLRLAARAARPSRRSSSVGVLDMAGNACYLLAVQAGALAVASVLSSLYPVMTVILAAVVLRERVTRDHAVGHRPGGRGHRLIGVGSA